MTNYWPGQILTEEYLKILHDWYSLSLLLKIFIKKMLSPDVDLTDESGSVQFSLPPSKTKPIFIFLSFQNVTFLKCEDSSEKVQ